MKKLFWLVLSTVILTGQSIFAQEADSEVQSSQREDSLLQVVNELSDRVQKTEDAARNERIWKKRAKYFNIGYITNQTLTDKVDAEAEWKSDFGVSLTFGKTYYLHKKPLLNMIKFGIDATWFELSYAKYSVYLLKRAESGIPSDSEMEKKDREPASGCHSYTDRETCPVF